MSALRNIFYVGTGTGVRLAFGILNFVVLPRMMGPENFSVFMFWFSVAMLISMLTNFGFPTYVLREGSAAPDRLKLLMGEVLTATLIVSSVVFIGCLITLPFLEPHYRAVFMVLVVAKLVDSGCDLFNVGFRVTNRFDKETHIGITSTFLQLPITAGALYFSPEPLAGAFALLLVRVVVFLVTIRSLSGYLDGIRLGSLRIAVQHFRTAWFYAADYGLQNLFGQIDSVVLAHYLGVSVVGVYQAGMRLFMGAAQAVAVLGTVFLPTATAAYAAKKDSARVLKQLQFSFLAVGCAGSLAFICFPKQITAILYGARFGELTSLLPIFGLLFFARCLSAVWGVSLTVIGKQNVRFRLALIQWVLIFASSAYLVPKFGSAGWLYSLILGNLFLAAGYLAACHSSRAGVPIRAALMGSSAYMLAVAGLVSFRGFL